MVTRDIRLAQFSTDEETASGHLELLCEDHRGTFVLPFPCSRRGDRWCNAQTGEDLEAEVIGWRPWTD